MKRIFVIAGEASGDLHGSNLVKSLLQKDPGLEIKGWGGDLIAESGVEILSHYRDRALMGFVEVLLNWRKIRSWFKMCKSQILAFSPDVLVLIDYGGFNLRMARFASQNGIKVHYYIPPKVWAWNEKRVKKLAAYTHSVSCILPFEENWFRTRGVNAAYVGNPLIKAIDNQPPQADFLVKEGIEKPYIALLPGSRKQEIRRILPEMIKAGRQMNNYQLVMAGAPGIPSDFYDAFDTGGIKRVTGNTYDVIRNCSGAIVTSGTATLETALLDAPQVVVYKAVFLSYLIASVLIKVKYISLVNLILDKPAVTELIQRRATAERIAKELKKAMNDPEIGDDYARLRHLITDKDASEETAARILA